MNQLVSHLSWNLRMPRSAQRRCASDRVDPSHGLPPGDSTAGVGPDVLVDTDDLHIVEAGRVVQEGALAFGKDGIVGGVPGHGQGIGEAGDGQVLADEPDQRPPQRGPRQLRAWFGDAAGFLAPDMAAAGALVATDPDQQRRRAPTQRLVRQPAGDGVPRPALAATLPAPPVQPCWVICDPAGQHRPLRVQVLADNDETELVQAAERRHVRGREGSVRHVEVFLDGGVRTSILGRPRPLPGHRRADRTARHPAANYTLSWEEPVFGSVQGPVAFSGGKVRSGVEPSGGRWRVLLGVLSALAAIATIVAAVLSGAG